MQEHTPSEMLLTLSAMATLMSCWQVPPTPLPTYLLPFSYPYTLISCTGFPYVTEAHVHGLQLSINQTAHLLQFDCHGI